MDGFGNIEGFSAVTSLLIAGSVFLGVALFILGLYGFYKKTENPQQYTFSYCIGNLIAGSMLLIPGSIYSIVKASGLKDGFSETRGVIGYSQHLEHAMATRSDTFLGNLLPGHIWGTLFGFVFLVGLYAFIKGIYLIRAVGDGQEGSHPKRIATHMIGGIICMNITTFTALLANLIGIN